jgi:hypothetical protein
VRLPGDIVAQHARRAAVRAEQCAENPNRGRLSGAIWTKEAVHGAALDTKVDAVHGACLAEMFDEGGNLDRGRHLVAVGLEARRR